MTFEEITELMHFYGINAESIRDPDDWYQYWSLDEEDDKNFFEANTHSDEFICTIAGDNTKFTLKTLSKETLVNLIEEFLENNP